MRCGTLRFLFLSFVGGLMSCYWPNYTGPYVCDPQQGGADCPSGWSCLDQRCTAPGMAPPEIAPQGGCAHQGMLLAMAHGGQLWACQGSFAAGGYATLCASAAGFHACGQDSDDDSLLTLLDCDAVKGFYLVKSNLTVTKNMTDMTYSGECDALPGSGQSALLGCGMITGVFQLSGSDCHYLHDALLCPSSADWSCTPETGLEGAARSAAATEPGGVLCCSDESD